MKTCDKCVHHVQLQGNDKIVLCQLNNTAEAIMEPSDKYDGLWVKSYTECRDFTLIKKEKKRGAV